MRYPCLIETRDAHRKMKMITVAIIEDNRLVREGITEMLNELPDVKLVHAGTSVETELLKEVNPTVAVRHDGMFLQR